MSPGGSRHPSVRMIISRIKEEKVTQADEEARRRAEQARQVGLFRYRLVSEVTGPQLSARQRGQRVRELAAAGHDGPGGGKVRISEQTIRRWVRGWRAGGFEALVPPRPG